MATTTLTVAADTDVSETLLAICNGPTQMEGCNLKAFTATVGTGTFPLAGFTLDLSALFPNKVYAVVITACYDPAATTGDLAFPAIYIPAAGNAPATGKVHLYSSNGAANAGLLHIPDDTVTLTGYVIDGFAIGF